VAKTIRGNETDLEVSKLSKLLATVVEATYVWFGLLVDDSVSANVATLGKPLITDLAFVWSLSSMAPYMSL
jgi:hypothetical protein